MKKISLETLWSVINPQTYLAEHIDALQNQNESLISILRAHNLHEEHCDSNNIIHKATYKGGIYQGVTNTPRPCDCILKATDD